MNNVGASGRPQRRTCSFTPRTVTKSDTELVAFIAANKKEWSFDYSDDPFAALAPMRICTRIEALL
ncbi:hypothetical protein [Burkholderia sp.]|uniref:hypothetical protein n=1 Tax=Burkholderia sp. TaxID=36773 RepID=UPI0025BB7745|nr:hypothetical protein [Burkholderia sp.]MBS6360757.1 hypothetical protein [Burkholderia sp.]